MPVLCPLCVRDENTKLHQRDDGITYGVCLDRSHGPDGFVWEPTPPPGRSFRSDGLGADLAIWDKLLEVVEAGEYQSYGLVEDRFVERFPEETRILAERFGHRWRFPEHPSTQYSMSAYLASRLKELEREGELDLSWDRAEGEWSHNGIISQWRRRDSRPSVRVRFTIDPAKSDEEIAEAIIAISREHFPNQPV
jgi:hypothetical protein